jgi:hypothetical protein
MRKRAKSLEYSERHGESSQEPEYRIQEKNEKKKALLPLTVTGYCLLDSLYHLPFTVSISGRDI